VFAGASGFSYPAWRGSFYPPKLPQRVMLAYYAERLDAVEANATFYRIPKPETLASWRRAVRPGFVFALKAPQRITHLKRLKDVDDLVAYFYQVAAELGTSLGPVLFQLPPTQKKDLPRLEDFLALLPKGGLAAVEFRHDSWLEDDVYSALAARGVALCLTESDESRTPLVPTAGFGYLRLRRTVYRTSELRAWCDRLRALPFGEVFVFFKHEDEARGPAYALALRDLALAAPADLTP
jgi:uncharacterized protein YecE (DUF72 family)